MVENYMMNIREYDNTGWEYNGTIEDFLHLIRWALVFQELSEENSPELMNIIRDKDRLREYAISNGITYRAIAEEIKIVAEAVLENTCGS